MARRAQLAQRDFQRTSRSNPPRSSSQKLCADGCGDTTACLTSPARAALGTAEALGLNPEIEMALRDCDYSNWRGLSLADVAATDADGFTRWLSDPDATPHGGESLNALIGRAASFLSDMLGSNGATLAITHSSMVRAVVVSALGAGPLAFWRIDVAPLSIARLSGREGRWNIASLGPEGGPR